NEHFSTELALVSTGIIQEYQASGPYGSPERFNESQAFVDQGAIDGLKQLVVRDENAYWNPHDKCACSDNFLIYTFRRNVYETRVDTSDPGKILAGSDMHIIANEVFNDKSQIIAGGRLVGEIDTLKNLDGLGKRTTSERGRVDKYWRDKNSG